MFLNLKKKLENKTKRWRNFEDFSGLEQKTFTKLKVECPTPPPPPLELAEL